MSVYKVILAKDKDSDIVNEVTYFEGNNDRSESIEKDGSPVCAGIKCADCAFYSSLRESDGIAFTLRCRSSQYVVGKVIKLEEE